MFWNVLHSFRMIYYTYVWNILHSVFRILYSVLKMFETVLQNDFTVCNMYGIFVYSFIMIYYTYVWNVLHSFIMIYYTYVWNVLHSFRMILLYVICLECFKQWFRMILLFVICMEWFTQLQNDLLYICVECFRQWFSMICNTYVWNVLLSVSNILLHDQNGLRCSSVVEHPLTVRLIVGSNPHYGPIEQCFRSSQCSSVTRGVVCVSLSVEWCL